MADVSENLFVQGMKVLILPVLLVAVWLMVAPSSKATPDDRVPSPTDVRSPSLPPGRLEAPAGHRKVEVDGVSLDMTEALGFPKSEEPGLAGCGLDSTTCWLYPIEGGSLRVYIYRDSHDMVEIEPQLCSTIVAFDLSDTVYGSFRGP